MNKLSKVILDMIDDIDIEIEETDNNSIDIPDNISLSMVSSSGTVDGYTLIEL